MGFSPFDVWAEPNSIQAENALPGDSDWKVSNSSRKGEIQAYAEEEHLARGGILHLHVSSKGPYQLDLYRLGYYGGSGARKLKTVINNNPLYQGAYYTTEKRQPDGTIKQVPPPCALDCPKCVPKRKNPDTINFDPDACYPSDNGLREANWDFTDKFFIQPEWISGLYFVKLTELGSKKQWVVPFVVREPADAKADLIYVTPGITDQAYNFWGGTSLYRDFSKSMVGNTDKAIYASLNRPNMQDGTEAGAGFLFTWTYPMARFLEEHGYNVHYTTGTAVHSNGLVNLGNYRGIISAGHDEYWTDLQRRKVEDAIAGGTSFLVFSGNTMYRQVRYQEAKVPTRLMIKYPDCPPDSRTQCVYDPVAPTGRFRDSPINNPEDRLLTTMSYGISRTMQDLAVTSPQHWIYNALAVSTSTVIPQIMGYEIDYLQNASQLNRPDETVTVLAESQYLAVNIIDAENPTGKRVRAMAVMRELNKTKNIIFTAGTIGWSMALNTDLPNPTFYTLNPTLQSDLLRKLTRNLLSRVLIGVAPPMNLSAAAGTDGCLQISFKGASPAGVGQGFEIYRSGPNNPSTGMSFLVKLGPTETSHKDCSVAPQTSYYYKARALTASSATDFTGLTKGYVP